ncbi:coiled-coil domain-containing protein 91-like [Lineus longissimus]|uniref:coiled-coil domain-containing protein 91-like n=1 Tax=Lineus longissimus TaxID=88925 RepID=UPI002B4CCD9A
MADDEDDFGEFGGFEAADPDLDGAGPVNVEASPSPWALFPAGTAAPDLIQAQGMVYPHGMEPPFVQEDVNAAAAGTNNNVQQPPESVGFYMENDLLVSNAQPSVSHDDVLELSHGSGSSDSNRSSGACHQRAAVPDIQSLDITAQSHPRSAPEADAPVDILPLELPGLCNHISGNEVPVSPSGGLVQGAGNGVQNAEIGQGEPAAAPGREDTEKVTELTEQLSVVEQEKERIQKDLEELLARHNVMIVDFETTQLQLAEQREKYKTLQGKHDKDLEEIRLAGHEALVVIVEEYKALCRVAVLEQKDVMEKYLHDCLKAERERFEETLESQRDRLVQSIEQDKVKNAEEMKVLREELQLLHQSEFEKFLQKEQEQQKEELKVAIREEHQASQRLLQAAIDEEREKTKALLAQEKENSRVALAAEQEKFTQVLKEAVHEERAKSKEAVIQCIKDEQERSKDLSRDVLEKSREAMKGYITENRQADATVRRKQLTSLDLFLEGARHQLTDLMSKTSEENG